MSEIDGSGEMETAIGTHVPAREIAHRPKDQFSPARSSSLHDGPWSEFASAMRTIT